MNIPNLPIQIMAVTDTGGANAFFSSDLSHLLMTEGNAVADRLQAHFMTSSSSCQQKSKSTNLIKQDWCICKHVRLKLRNYLYCKERFSPLLNLQLPFTPRFSKKYGTRNLK